MKKKIAGCLILVVFLLFLLITYSFPTSLIKNDDFFMIVSIHYQGSDVTDQVDLEDLIQILEKYQKKRTLKQIPNTQPEIEINLVNEQQPLHIIIGKEALCYKDSGGKVWGILEGEQFKKELLLLL
ncbi:MAG TPA: hypothetical protein H9672_01295 [Firmicutes bacterium]|nr:hypothetical protein [Bacillota bacterium]